MAEQLDTDKPNDLRPEPAKGLLHSSALVGGATLVSRVLGLVRDVVLANLVGATSNADAFFVAFKIPNFLRRLFAEGAFAQAFIPVLTETREQGGLEAVRALVDRVTGVLGGVLILLTTATILAAPLVALVFAPGFSNDPGKLSLTADLIRITFPYLFLISMTGFAGGILNAYGRFGVPAFTPVLLNLSLIAAALYLAPVLEEPVYALALGVMLAGLLQLLFQIPSLYGLELIPRPRWDTKHSGVKQILTLMVPALFGVSVSQINLLLDTVLASLLPAGSVSWLYYSDRLTELPLGIFAIAVATVILPNLSSQQARATAADKSPAFVATLHWALGLIVFVALPATAALVLLAKPILTTLFQYGAFSPGDVDKAAWSLRAYALGLTAFMLIKVLAPGYYARQDMKTPVRIGVIAMVANMVMNPIFIFPLMWLFDLGHVGLALATSVAAWLNAGLLYCGLRRKGLLLGVTRFRLARAAHIFIAIVVMLGVLWLCLPGAGWWQGAVALHRGLAMAVLVMLGGLAYGVTLWCLGLRLRDLKSPTVSL